MRSADITDAHLTVIIVMFDLFDQDELSTDSFMLIYLSLCAGLSRVVPAKSEDLITELFWICEDLPFGSDKAVGGEIGHLRSMVVRRLLPIHLGGGGGGLRVFGSGGKNSLSRFWADAV